MIEVVQLFFDCQGKVQVKSVIFCVIGILSELLITKN